MTVIEAISARQSVKVYRPDPIPDEVLVRLVAAAHLAPSSNNVQPWEFVIVTDPELKKRLRVAANNQEQVERSAATIVVLGSLRQEDRLADQMEAALPADAPPERRERVLRNVKRHREDADFRRDHVRTNTFIGTSFLVLAAQSLGIASSWMGGFDPNKVRDLLGIPEHYIVCSLVALGYPPPDLPPRPRLRRPLAEIYSFNGFQPR